MDDLSKAYLALGLKAGASLDEIKQAYRDMVKVWHPDRFSHDPRLRAIAQDKLKEINGAYEVVKAGFFEASVASAQPTTDQAGAAEESPPAEPPPAAGRRTVLWAALGVVALALIAGSVLMLVKTSLVEPPDTTSHTAADRPPHALVFNPGGRVEISTTGALAGTFTVECWTSTRRPRGTGTILSSRGPKDFTFDIKFREGKRFHGDIGDGTRWLMRMANARFSYNPKIWYHVAYVVTPARYSIYVNGDLEDDGQIHPAGDPLLYDAEHRLCLGADVLEPADLDGSIAEVRIWRTARTADQIKANMNLPLNGNESGLQGYWRFAEGSGTETIDNSGHGFIARLIGNVQWTTNTPTLAGSAR